MVQRQFWGRFICIVCCVFFLSGCTVNSKEDLQFQNSQNIAANYSGCLIEGNHIYYPFSNKEKFTNELKMYNKHTQKSNIIDTGWAFGDIQISDKYLYYIKYDGFEKGSVVRCDKDGSNKRSLFEITTAYAEGESSRIILYQNDVVYFLNKDTKQLYNINTREIMINNITEISLFDDKIYYTDSANNIHEYNILDKTDKLVVLFQDIMTEIALLKDTNWFYEGIIYNMTRIESKLYFIISIDDMRHSGGLVSYDIEKRDIALPRAADRCKQIKVWDSKLYIIVQNNKHFKIYQYNKMEWKEISINQQDINLSSVYDFYVDKKNIYLFGQTYGREVESVNSIKPYFKITDLHGKIKRTVE